MKEDTQERICDASYTMRIVKDMCTAFSTSDMSYLDNRPDRLFEGLNIVLDHGVEKLQGISDDEWTVDE